MRKLASTVVLAAALVASPTAAQEACRWERVEAPEPGPVVELNDVVAISPDEAWAVGSWNSGGEFSRSVPLAIRWDGEGWEEIDTPTTGGGRTHALVALDGGPGYLWAVGWSAKKQDLETRERDALIMRWDGSMWRLVPAPSATHSETTLSDVLRVGPNEAWIVGTRHHRSGRTKSLILHLDDGEALIVPSGNRRHQSRSLTALTAVAPNELWAVGTRTWRSGRSNAIALRFNENERQTFRIPRPPNAIETMPTDISAAAPTRIWAVGSYAEPNSSSAFVARTSSRGWYLAPAPPMGTGGINDFKGLNDIDASSFEEAWAAGQDSVYDDQSGERRSRVVIAHWNGHDWTIDTHETGHPARLEEVEMTPDGGWAVGTTYAERDESEPSFAPPTDGLILEHSCN